VVDIHYPYNTLFGRGTLNAFEAVISYSYLCMKMSAINGVIIVHGDQTEARNIEKNTLLVGKIFIQSRKKRKKKQKIRSHKQKLKSSKKQTKCPLTH
jgi:tRNA(Ser,Leu) C12 N-acetylase TAN1